MGYRWKRTRYAPAREPDPEEEREARGELKALKGGRVAVRAVWREEYEEGAGTGRRTGFRAGTGRAAPGAWSLRGSV